MERLTILCPCCEATLTVDATSGAVISHEEKEKQLSTFEELQKDLEKQSERREQLFAQEKLAQKDRAKILDEKFKDAFEKADKDSDEPFKNPLDFD